MFGLEIIWQRVMISNHNWVISLEVNRVSFKLAWQGLKLKPLNSSQTAFVIFLDNMGMNKYIYSQGFLLFAIIYTCQKSSVGLRLPKKDYALKQLYT